MNIDELIEDLDTYSDDIYRCKYSYDNETAKGMILSIIESAIAELIEKKKEIENA